MIPAFHSEKQGYNKREVDKYVDDMLAENKRITHVNNQLFLLWLTQSSQNEAIETEKLNGLLVESAKLQQPVSTVQHVPDISESVPQPADVTTEAKHHVKKSSKVKSICFNFVFYAALIAVVLGVFLFKDSGTMGPPQDIAGFSVMTVLTRSMQDVLPQNSLIVTKRVDPSTIQVGDDITYLMSNNSTVTHRVIKIHQNYAGTGQPGFETQGTMNERPDAEIVGAANVVGRVIFNSLTLGKIILFIRAHVLWVSILAALIIALGMTLRVVLSKHKHERVIKNSA